jgi:hypothetical protein
MEIRRTISPEMELIDEVDYQSTDSLLARKIQQLMIFFALLIPDMSNEEEQMLDEALIKTYSDFGITHDNETLKLTRAEIRNITQFERGEALVTSNNNKVPVLVKVSKLKRL